MRVGCVSLDLYLGYYLEAWNPAAEARKGSFRGELA